MYTHSYICNELKTDLYLAFVGVIFKHHVVWSRFYFKETAVTALCNYSTKVNSAVQIGLNLLEEETLLIITKILFFFFLGKKFERFRLFWVNNLNLITQDANWSVTRSSNILCVQDTRQKLYSYIK
jgi:hypothetical protein